jgi:hypothetical protein
MAGVAEMEKSCKNIVKVSVVVMLAVVLLVSVPVTVKV